VEDIAETPAAESHGTASVEDIAPATEPETGPHGPIFRQFHHDAQGAIAHLTKVRDGEAIGALHHPEVGDIDLVWGEKDTPDKEGHGLAKISDKHKEVMPDLQGFISKLHVDQARSGPNRKILVSQDKQQRAAVRLDWNGETKNWLLSAYDKNARKEVPPPAESTTDVPSAISGETAASPDGGVPSTNIAPPGSAVNTPAKTPGVTALDAAKQKAAGKDYYKSYEWAVEIVKTKGGANPKTLQLRLGIPKAKVAEYIERMLADGIIGPQPKPGKPYPKLKQKPVDLTGKEPWEMTADEFITFKGINAGRREIQQAHNEHSAAVYAAVEAGKPVPANVLKEYPTAATKAKAKESSPASDESKIEAGEPHGEAQVPIPDGGRTDDSGALAEQLPGGSESAGGRRPTGKRGGSRGVQNRKSGKRVRGEGDATPVGTGSGMAGVGDSAGPQDGFPNFPPRSGNVGDPNLAHDYRIPDDRGINASSPEKAAAANIAAIKLLRSLEADTRAASAEEKDVLARYVGWGNVPQIFAANTPEWQAVQDELKSLISDQEYAEAQRSTTNAHYTGDSIVDAMWAAVQHLGAKPGMVWLEPAVGVGNFFGRQPVDLLQGARRVGMDKDALTAGIAKYLYPDSGIDHVAFEQAELPNDYFDAAISNVPFGNFGVHDPAWKTRKHLTYPIHNYFFAKSLDYVRPGGVIAFVTSRYTMDGYEEGHKKFRDYVASKADFLGAVRLPTNAFKKSSGTHVITDIIFLRRRLPDETAITAANKGAGHVWQRVISKHLRPKEGNTEGWAKDIPTNEYYHLHPENVLGTENLARGQFGPNDYNIDGAVTTESLTKALKATLPTDAFQDFKPAKKSNRVATRDLSKTDEAKKLGGLFFDDKGDLYRKTSKGSAEPVDANPTLKANIRGQLKIRDSLLALVTLERQNGAEGELKLRRAQLNALYDNFVLKNGPLSKRANQAAMVGDPDAPLLTALETRFDPKKNTAEKAPIFSKRIFQADIRPTSAGDAKTALYISLNETGGLDWPRMQELTGKTAAQLQQELGGLVYEDPETKVWQTADEYLSGAVRSKLVTARKLAKVEPRFEANVEALKGVQPTDIPPSRIRAAPGVTWVPLEIYGEWLKDVLNTDKPPNVQYANGEWMFPKAWGAASKWATAKATAWEIAHDTMNQRRTKVTYKDADDVVRTDKDATLAAREKQQQLIKYFEKWLFADTTRADQVTRLYNDLVNDLRLRTFDGSHLTLPGISREMFRTGNPEPYQLAGIARIISQKNVYLAHTVGSGKTATMIISGMELQRMGLIKRPMYVVPNSTLAGWQKQFAELYPQKRALIFTEKDLARDKRRQVFAQIATGDWDAVVVPHSSFAFIPVGDAIFADHFERKAKELQESIDMANETGDDSRMIKRMEKAKEALLTSMQERRNETKQDQTATWEEMGIDQLYLDEAHEYKKLGFSTKQQSIAGIDPNGNQKTFDLRMKVEYTQTHGRGAVFASGTPVTNTMGELFNIFQYLITPDIKARGIGRFDEWSANFGRTVDHFEPKPEGGGHHTKPRFSEFVNVAELAQLWRSFADVLTSDMLDVPRPKVRGGARRLMQNELDEAQHAEMNDLQGRAGSIRADARKAMPDNMAAIYTDAQKIVMDARMMDEAHPDTPGNRLNELAAEIHRLWVESTPVQGTQLVFADFGIPQRYRAKSRKPRPADARPLSKFSTYDALVQKLVALGIPENEVAIVHSATTPNLRKKLFQDVDDGIIRVLIGSTGKMGTGVNMHHHGYALHHVTLPHRPADLEQREGRFIRPGNPNPEVDIVYYGTKNSLDELKFNSVSRKQKAFNKFMQGGTSMREMEDVDDMAPSLDEFTAAVSGDPRIKRKLELDNELLRLSVLESEYRDEKWTQRRDLNQLPGRIASEQRVIKAYGADIATRDKTGRVFVIGGKTFEGDGVQKAAAAAIAKVVNENKGTNGAALLIGTAYGLPLHQQGTNLYVGTAGAGAQVSLDWHKEKRIITKGAHKGEEEEFSVATLNPIGTFTVIENAVKGLDRDLKNTEKWLEESKRNQAVLESAVNEPWPNQAEYDKLLDEKQHLDQALGVGKDAAAALDGEDIENDAVEAEDAPESDEEETPAEERDVVSKPKKAKKANPEDGLPMSEYVAEPARMSPMNATDFGLAPSKAWNVVDGQVWFTDGKGAWKGEPPADWNRDPKEKGGPDIAKVIPKEKGADVEPLGFTKKEGRVIVFNDGSGMDADYYDWTNQQYGRVTWTHGEGKNKAFQAWSGNKRVAVVVPLKLDKIPSSLQPGNRGERGGALLEVMSGGLSNLFKGKAPGELESSYSGMGAAQDVTTRNLSQLRRANEHAHEKAVQFATSRSQSAVLLRIAAPRIEAALGKDVSWLDFRRALIQSRLVGIRDRWSDMLVTAEEATNDDLGDAMGRWLFHLLDKLHYPTAPGQTAAALLSREDFEGLHALLDDAFGQAYDHTASIMTPEEFKRITTAPTFAKGLKAYKDLAEKAIAENHAENEGVFSDALGPLDTYYPLIAITEGDELRAQTALGAPYKKSANADSNFATGQADDYDPGMEALGERIRASFRRNNKAALLDALEGAGLLRKIPEGDEIPDTMEYKGKTFRAAVVPMGEARTLIQPGGKIVHLPITRGIVPDWLEKELAPLLDKKNLTLYNPKNIIARITAATLAGPTDFVFHSSNLIGTLVARTPFLGESLVSKVAENTVPFVKRAVAMLQLWQTDPSTDEAAADLIAMAKLGLLPERFASVTYSRKFAEQTGAEWQRFKGYNWGPTLYGPHGIDVRARLLMYRLQKRIDPGATPTEQYLFVNQLGNYTRVLQGDWERSLKDTLFSPFATAGTTMNRNGVNTILGTGPQAKRMPWWQRFGKSDALKLAAWWALLHWAYRHKWPWEEKDSKLLKIKLLPHDAHSAVGKMMGGNKGEVYINIGFASPLVGRGARALGLQGAYDTKMAKGSTDQVLDAALTGAINSALSPVMGPPAKFAFLGLTGTEPYITGIKNAEGQLGLNFFPAVRPQKPGAAGFFKQHLIPPIVSMNSLFANVGAATGFTHGIMREDLGGNKGWAAAGRVAVNLFLPQLVDKPVKPGAHRGYLAQQRRGETSGAEKR